ncbi:GNAT family N-acetyltransferase [Thermithiobacillus plumbiphilus]|uniref:GNAT family N-acetyltransferase n=1 Tax=Thermithiobacillus plumbiphilus TaxID=1729899 RepID=A0ABU9DC11_9PROT
MQIDILPDLGSVNPQQWDALNPTGNPFLRHAFLHSLERSGCVGADSGWQPCHILLRDDAGELRGAMPLYAKSHSYGEYVFDWAWARAYQGTGQHYYPKLVSAVPFSPVTGPRLLTDGDEASARLLLQAAIQLAADYSSLHVLFPDAPTTDWLAQQDLLIREGLQYHWNNREYRDFDDFLSHFASRKRKQVKRERREAQAEGMQIECLEGADIQPVHWDAMYRFYRATIDSKGAIPYLNRRFFHMLGESMPESCVLFLARQDGDYVAGALNLRGPQGLYGRYWGSLGDFPNLHFELCYYQGIEYCISRGLSRFEAGAQGEHKIARGFLPEKTYSAHWLAHAGFRDAVADFLTRERTGMDMLADDLRTHAPFRQCPPPEFEDQ